VGKQSTYIIAEAGVNHNGFLQQGLELIDIAIDAKANAVKFQTFHPSQLKKFSFTDPLEIQYSILKRLALSPLQYKKLKDYASSKNMDFILTPFDLEGAAFLIQDLKLSTIHITVPHEPLLLMLARSGCHLILSSNMDALMEIETALSILAYGFLHSQGFPSKEALKEVLSREASWDLLKEKVTLLYDTSSPSIPLEEINLSALRTLHETFPVPVGFSDGSLGIYIPMAACALGATMIEKPFTIDKKLPGPYHKTSLEPHELKSMVQGIRDIETVIASQQEPIDFLENQKPYGPCTSHSCR